MCNKYVPLFYIFLFMILLLCVFNSTSDSFVSLRHVSRLSTEEIGIWEIPPESHIVYRIWDIFFSFYSLRARAATEWKKTIY